MSKTSGKHNPDDVLIGFMDSPEVKALTALVAEAEGDGNVSDMLRRLIFEKAEEHGMMRGRKVTARWLGRVKDAAEVIRANKRTTSERRRKSAS